VIGAAPDGIPVGALHDYDMNALGIPPAPGEMRPIGAHQLTVEPEGGRWPPRLVITAP
jgi:hypothetical protein